MLTGLVVISLGKLCATSKALADIFIVPLALFAFLYSSVGHALYGRTVGKYLLKIPGRAAGRDPPRLERGRAT